MTPERVDWAPSDRQVGGGFQRPDRIFDGQLLQTLEAINDSLWAQPAAWDRPG